MASPIFEQEPNYINHVNFDNVVDSSLLDSTLDSVANQVKLGDTNSAVPVRLLGMVMAYKEAGASEYILDTVVLSGLILGPILSILVVLCTLKNGGVCWTPLFSYILFVKT